MDESENEVIEELGENPMRAYKLQFPYQVKFCLAGDDHRTEVINQHHFRRDDICQDEKGCIASEGTKRCSIQRWIHQTYRQLGSRTQTI